MLQVVGAWGFIISSLMFCLEVQRRWWLPAPFILGWQVLNCPELPPDTHVSKLSECLQGFHQGSDQAKAVFFISEPKRPRQLYAERWDEGVCAI